MVCLRPFRGLRPPREISSMLAAPAYDTLSSEEAKVLSHGNERSFLHVNKPEIDLPANLDPYDSAVYRKGTENLVRFIANGWLRRDEKPSFYVYMQEMNSRQQYGILGGCAVEEYEKGLIKRHELTRAKKEEDRTRLTDEQNANIGPVFLTYKSQPHINDIVSRITSQIEKSYDFVDISSGLPVRHVLWPVSDDATVNEITSAFKQVDAFYVADGHHRAASAFNVGKRRRAEANRIGVSVNGEEGFNYFMAVVFPHDHLRIMDYNRLVRDLNGLSDDEFKVKLAASFDITPVASLKEAQPTARRQFGMYLSGQWYQLSTKQGVSAGDTVVDQLDVSLLTNVVLTPILAIGDLRSDERIDFVGGIRGLEELEKRVKSGEMKVAFAVYPVSLEELMDISDAGMLMPPKSTWFEPKLMSGLVVKLLDE